MNNDRHYIFTKLVCVTVAAAGMRMTVGKLVSNYHPLVNLLKYWLEEIQRQLLKLCQ